jgi:tRNA A37 methylthiotransferase MiaB
MRTVGEAKRDSFRRRFLERELEAIVIRKGPRGAEVLTSNYIAIRVPNCYAEPGGAVRVRITQVESGQALGEEAG